MLIEPEPRRHPALDIEANAIVLDGEGQTVGAVVESHGDPGGSAVLGGVLQRFLCDPEQAQRQFGREGCRNGVDA